MSPTFTTKTYSGRIFSRKEGLWRGVREGMGALGQLEGYVRSAWNVDSKEGILRQREGLSRLNRVTGTISHVAITGNAKGLAVDTRVYIGGPTDLFLSGDPFAEINGNQYDQTAVDEMAGVTDDHLNRWEHEEP